MKILITGGCGFLGSNLASNAIRSGNKIIVFDNLSRYGASNNLQWLQSIGEFEFIHGDIRSFNDIAQVIKKTKPDAIFHLAGQVAMTTSIQDPKKDFEINTVGTHNLLESVRKCSPDSIVIYSSTNKVYGDLERYDYVEDDTRYRCREFPMGFNEQTPLNFESPYGCSKGAADQFMLDYARMFGLRTVVFRHSSMYGGRQYATYDQGWISWFCLKAIEISQGKLIDGFTISGNGKQVRDVLHGDDMFKLYDSAINCIERVSGHVFNIGGGIDNSLSLLELFNILERRLNIKMKYSKLPPRESDQKIFVADISKAKELLDWKPQISIEAGINKVIEWSSNL
ncbi:MAG: NAD-dependent epimerase/dehydratase family protein [Gammaproteobacteria bacterium]|nr:MAG: NAD-dependent epimerase/dehydratase family protein [Gammaproteobacteria bacterium]